MNRFEKMSWYSLVFCIISISSFLVLLPFAGVFIATAMFGFLGIAGLAPVIFRGKEPADERDLLILRRAQFAGHLMFWLLFVLGSICTWGVLFYRGIESIPIQTLPLMVFWGMWIIVTVQSVTTVILYRRRGIGVEHYDR